MHVKQTNTQHLTHRRADVSQSAQDTTVVTATPLFTRTSPEQNPDKTGRAPAVISNAQGCKPHTHRSAHRHASTQHTPHHSTAGANISSLSSVALAANHHHHPSTPCPIPPPPHSSPCAMMWSLEPKLCEAPAPLMGRLSSRAASCSGNSIAGIRGSCTGGHTINMHTCMHATQPRQHIRTRVRRLAK